MADPLLVADPQVHHLGVVGMRWARRVITVQKTVFDRPMLHHVDVLQQAFLRLDNTGIDWVDVPQIEEPQREPLDA